MKNIYRSDLQIIKLTSKFGAAFGEFVRRERVNNTRSFLTFRTTPHNTTQHSSTMLISVFTTYSAVPLGRGIRCLFCVQILICSLPHSLYWYMQYHVILDRAITSSHCISHEVNILVKTTLNIGHVLYAIKKRSTFTSQICCHLFQHFD